MPDEFAVDKASDLPELFKAWGLRMLPDQVVGDGGLCHVGWHGSAGSVPVRHPGWLALPKKALDSSDVITAQLHDITLATAGILTATGKRENPIYPAIAQL